MPASIRFEVVADSSDELVRSLADIVQAHGMKLGPAVLPLSSASEEDLIGELVHRGLARNEQVTVVRESIPPGKATTAAGPAKRRGRPPKATTAPAPVVAPDETGEDEDDGEDEDERDEISAGLDDPEPPAPAVQTALPPEQALLKALENLRTLYARATGAKAVKKLQKEWGVAKFAEINLDRAHELLKVSAKLLEENPA